LKSTWVDLIFKDICGLPYRAPRASGYQDISGKRTNIIKKKNGYACVLVKKMDASWHVVHACQETHFISLYMWYKRTFRQGQQQDTFHLRGLVQLTTTNATHVSAGAAARHFSLSPPPRHPICDQTPLLPQKSAASHRPRSPSPLMNWENHWR